MDQAEIKARAVRGALVLALRGVAVRIIGFVGFIAIAAALGTAGIGQLSFGLAVLTMGGLVVDGGLAAGLIRRASDPVPGALGAVLGLQLIVAAVVVGTVWWIGAGFGETGLVTAIIVTSLVPLAARTPPIVACERELRYLPIAWTDLSDTALLYGGGALLAALGGGPTGIAVIALARTVVGTGLLYALVPSGRVYPSWKVSRAGSVLRFGAQFQATAVVSAIRDQGLNFLIAGLFGLSDLGLWNLAYRVMQVPFLIFQAIWRVSYPTMARLREAPDGMRGVVGAMVRRSAFLTAVMMPVLCTAAFFGIPAILGSSWVEAAQVVPWASAGLLVSGPISVAAAGWLYARGLAGRVLLTVSANAVVWIVVGISLVPVLGVEGLGIGWMAACIVEALLFRRYLGNAKERLTLSMIAPAVSGGLLAGAAGLGVGVLLGGGFASAVGGSCAAFFAIIAFGFRFMRDEVWRYVPHMGGRLMRRRA